MHVPALLASLCLSRSASMSMLTSPPQPYFFIFIFFFGTTLFQLAIGHAIADGTKWCYSVAFGLLALSSALNVDVAAAKEPLDVLLRLAEDTFYEKEHGLYIDSYSQDFKSAASYRGQF